MLKFTLIHSTTSAHSKDKNHAEKNYVTCKNIDFKVGPIFVQILIWACRYWAEIHTVVAKEKQSCDANSHLVLFIFTMLLLNKYLITSIAIRYKVVNSSIYCLRVTNLPLKCSLNILSFHTIALHSNIRQHFLFVVYGYAVR